MEAMVGRYRRTVSFPDPTPPTISGPAGAPSAAKSYHVRSASLPCGRSHPLIPHLRHQINHLRSIWHPSRPASTTCTTISWLLEGLSLLNTLLQSLDDILQMPLTQDSLSRSTSLVDNLLEGFLLLVDVFGIFQSSMLSLKQELSSSQVAVRRKDDSNLSLSVKSQKDIAKDMSKLVSTVRSIPSCPRPPHLPVSDHLLLINDDDHEIPSVIRDVHDLTGLVSAALFEGLLRLLGPVRRRSISSSSSWSTGLIGFGLPAFPKKHHHQPHAVAKIDEAGSVDASSSADQMNTSLWGVIRKQMNGAGDDRDKRTGMLKKMEEVEDCVIGMEKGSERVFRSLISTRVSLLNILTHA